VDQPCAELSWEDLENKSRALYKGIYFVLRCQTVLKDTGVCYKDSEVSNCFLPCPFTITEPGMDSN